tara:strand:+ start:97573 stop:98235 length:663 start_codon:yes stop_codon:yes gene_type:complete
MQYNLIYHFHPVSKIYTGSSSVELDPIESKPLLPANATLTAPMVVAANQVAVFNDTAWSVVADHRGYSGFDASGDVKTINEIGIEPDPSWTEQPPFVFDDAIAIKRNQIILERDVALFSQKSTVEASGSIWQSNPGSMAELNDALTLSMGLGETPAGIEWRDEDNVNHPATLALLLSIAAARAVQKNAIWQQSWALKAQLDALDSATATQADIDAIEVVY